MSKDNLGKIAYDTYCECRGWKSYNGDPLPQWKDVEVSIKEGWIKSAVAVEHEVLMEMGINLT